MAQPILPLKELSVMSGEHFTIEQDFEVPIENFFVIVSKRKLRSISDFTEEECREFMDILRKLRKGMNEIANVSDVYLFQNEDTKHNFHLWVFPRYTWMEKFGRKIESVRPIMQYAEKNMKTKKHLESVKESVKKMRQYFE